MAREPSQDGQHSEMELVSLGISKVEGERGDELQTTKDPKSRGYRERVHRVGRPFSSSMLWARNAGTTENGPYPRGGALSLLAG